ncbi:DUF4434 domain-containing protein [Victivallaceae bacterium BBE-744-WT-12]|uniref:DUF4434 domain-containing protein n=1 Tax=Victivallis lenta TaxID=2606640 RepID=A0A844G5D8_9BACT|nr:DUF4434 domain-containing protein [Victivallis lenta]MST99007.1 DUF4434 domain-containing protein [Victivallis lenta]
MRVRKAVDPLRRLISGSFVQLDHWDDREGSRFQQELRALSPDHWRQMLQDMAGIGIDTLVFQQGIDARNGMDDIRAYYPSGHWRVPDWMRGKPLLYSEIVDEAERLGMTVIHGIYAMHWPDPYRYADRAIELAGIVVRELYELYGHRRGFGGWYWTYEYPPGSVSGRDCLCKLVPSVRAVADCPFMIAPCADRGICASVLQDIDVDIIAYQDTVGLGVEPDIFGRYARADRLRSLERLLFLYEMLRFSHDGWQSPECPEPDYWNYYTRKRGRTALWNDVEIWEFDHRRELIPAELSRITAQLDLTAPYVDKQIIYQYPGLMHHPGHPVPVGGERARTLYETYAVYREAVLAGRK